VEAVVVILFTVTLKLMLMVKQEISQGRKDIYMYIPEKIPRQLISGILIVIVGYHLM
jgi:hypothetical protein